MQPSSSYPGGSRGFFSRTAIECSGDVLGSAEGRSHERRSLGHYEDLTETLNAREKSLAPRVSNAWIKPKDLFLIEAGRLSSSGALFVLKAFNNFIELIR